MNQENQGNHAIPWKDWILNLLMLAAVAAAFIVTWLHPAPDAQGAGETPVQAALPTITPAPAGGLATAPPAPTATPDPILSYRTRRDEDRRREEQSLLALIDSDHTSPETRASAQAALLQMQENREIEWAVEAVLAGHGQERGLCVARQGAVTIILDGAIDAEEAELLLHLAREASGAAAENIRIAPM